MAIRSLILPALLSIGLSHASYTFQPNSCDATKQAFLKTELLWAQNIASVGITEPSDGTWSKDLYWKTFFSKDLRDRGFSWWSSVSKVFTNIQQQLDPNNDNLKFDITCEDTSALCQNSNPAVKYWAHMNPSTNVMNFCDRFFDPNEGIVPYQTRKDQCDEDKLDLRAAHRSCPIVIIHELTHTADAMDPLPRTRDYAYGFNGCFLLPIGQFDRSCVPYKGKGGKIECPSAADPNVEGVCAADTCSANADTWAFLAAGAGFSFYCQKQIPLPALPPTTPASTRVRRSENPRRSLHRRDATCDALKEPPLQFDNGPGW